MAASHVAIRGPASASALPIRSFIRSGITVYINVLLYLWCSLYIRPCYLSNMHMALLGCKWYWHWHDHQDGRSPPDVPSCGPQRKSPSLGSRRKLLWDWGSLQTHW